MRLNLISAVGAALLLCFGTAAAAPAVVVASKIDTEGALLGNMILAMLGDHGIAVRNRLQLGPTNIVRAAILAAQIDIYPEYTGNGALFFHMETDPVWKSWAKGYARVAALDKAKNDLVWLAPAPANNTWVIAVRKDLAERAGLKTMTDFARYVRGGGYVYLAASAEFVESPSALPAFEAAYGFRADRPAIADPVRRQHLGDLARRGRGDVRGQRRDGLRHRRRHRRARPRGARRRQGAQIVYAPAPVVRGAVLREYPQLPGLLDPVFNSLTLDILQQLNAKIAVDGEDAGAVADRLSQIAAFPAVTAEADPAPHPPALAFADRHPQPGPVCLGDGGGGGRLDFGLYRGRTQPAGFGETDRVVAGGGRRLDRRDWRHRRAVAGNFADAVKKSVSAGAAVLSAGLLLLTLAALGHSARIIAASAGPAARVSAGTAFWVIASCAALAIIDALQRLRAGPALLVAAVVALAGGAAALAFAGVFDMLSIAREYQTRHALFAAALTRHIALVAGSVGPALVIGFPLGVAAARRPRLQGPLFAILNLLQTVPSIALFGLLIAPLSSLAAAVPRLAALGVGGIGPAPAIIALVLYALLPIVRNTATGISGIDPAVIDAGAGDGADAAADLLRGSSCHWHCRYCSPGCAS